MQTVTDEQLTVTGSAEELERFAAAVAGSSRGKPLLFSYEAALPTPPELAELRILREWRETFWGRRQELRPDEVSLERSEPGQLVYEFPATGEPAYLLFAELASRFPALTLTLVHSDAADCAASVIVFSGGLPSYREVAGGRSQALDLLRRWWPEQTHAWADRTAEARPAATTAPGAGPAADLPARHVVCALCGSSELWEHRAERQLVRAYLSEREFSFEPLAEAKTDHLSYQCSDCGHELDDEFDADQQPPQTPRLQLV